MNRAQYRRLIAQCEADFRKSPTGMMTRALFYGYSGYIWLAIVDVVVSAFFTAIATTLVVMKAGLYDQVTNCALIIGLATFSIVTALIIKSAWVESPPPRGFPLIRSEAPALFEMVDRAKAQLRAPQIDSIVLTPDYNAAIYPRFRFAGLRPSENHLILGYPFLQAHPVEEVQSVIGHELGHIFGKAGRLHRWLMWLSSSWAQLACRILGTNSAGKWLGCLVRRYSLGLQARSSVVARHQEYIADAAASDISGKDVIARALVRLSYVDSALDLYFWPKIWLRSLTEELPPSQVFDLVQAEIAQKLEKDQQQHVKRLLCVRDVLATDRHPSLTARLEALQVPISACFDELDPALQGECGLTLLTTDARNRFRQLFCRQWKAENISAWREKHRRHKVSAVRLQQLMEKEEKNCLTQDEDWELTSYRVDASEYAKAVTRLQDFLKRHPQHEHGNMALARVFVCLGLGDKAVPVLKELISENLNCYNDALDLLMNIYESQGDYENLAGVEKLIKPGVLRLPSQKPGYRYTLT